MKDALEKKFSQHFQAVEREIKDAQPNLDDRDVMSELTAAFAFTRRLRIGE